MMMMMMMMMMMVVMIQDRQQGEARCEKNRRGKPQKDGFSDKDT
jgi:hypothetical protein